MKASNGCHRRVVDAGVGGRRAFAVRSVSDHRVGIGLAEFDTGAGDPLPVSRVAAGVGIDQRVPKLLFAFAPVDQEVFYEERGHHHPDPVVHHPGVPRRRRDRRNLEPDVCIRPGAVWRKPASEGRSREVSGPRPGGLIVAARSDRPSVRRRETRRQFVRSSRLTAIAARKAGRRPP
jgi:hypothetical protein